MQHFWKHADEHEGGPQVADEEETGTQKSGILSDTPQLTEVRIATVREKLSYDVKAFTVKAGKKIKLTFANIDFMPHNLLLVQPGKADEIGKQAVELGAKGFEVGFIPESKDILWHSKLLEQGKEEIIEFTAPTAPGDYPFICSFPGHHNVMRGVMKVKP